MTKVDEKAAELSEQLKAELGEIDFRVTTGYTLADAMREGSSVTDQAVGAWGYEDGSMCALSAAVVAGVARGRL